MTAYSPTTWVNLAPPGMSADNLNNLTDELEAQASEQGISHTLPTWVDGAAPAITSATPWNEMERVAALVAESVGLSYSPTDWYDGWNPPRNAFRLNRLEAQVAANRTALDTPAPPSGTVSEGIGFLFGGSTYNKSYGATRAEMIFCNSRGSDRQAQIDWPNSMAFPYNAASDVSTGWSNGVAYSVALANGWLLRDPQGVLVQDSGYRAYVGDVGLLAYQQEWVRDVTAWCQSANIRATFIDNCGVRGNLVKEGTTTATTLAKYPTSASWKAAMQSFLAYVGPHLRASGIATIINITPSAGRSAGYMTEFSAMIDMFAPYVTHVCMEYFMQGINSGPNIWSDRVSKSGWTYWFDGWDEQMALIERAHANGANFMGLMQSTFPESSAQYGRCSILLNAAGASFADHPGDVMTSGGGGSTMGDLAGMTWQRLLGQPTGAKVRNGNRWQRQFANALVWVDPITGTSGFS